MITYASLAPSVYRKAIVLCCDAGFFRYAAFLVSQIADQHPVRDFDICLCSEEALALPGTLDDLAVRLCQIAIPDAIRAAPQSDRINLSSYLRLFVPTAFAADYDRILYLDSDILLRSGDLSKLLDVALIGDHPIAAVRTSHQRTGLHKQMPEFKALGQKPAPYFNAGVMVIDIERWEQGNCLSRALDVIAAHPDALVMHDQSVLNILFRDNWSELSVVWNWLYSGRFSYLIEAFDPFLIHFAGKAKPWNRFNGEFPPKYVNIYRDFFGRHFPDEVTRMPPPPSILAAARFHKKSLLKQWYDFNKLARYIERFDDPYRVIDPRH